MNISTVTHLKRRLARWLRGIATNIAGLLPHPRSGSLASRNSRVIQRIIVIGRFPNPTFDYYLRARLESSAMPPFILVDLRHLDLSGIDPVNSYVIICRYASRSVLAWINRHAATLAGVGLFVDDDVRAVVTGADAKVGYRLFLLHYALAPLISLNRYLDTVWASTPALAAALGGRAVVLPPVPHGSTWNVARRTSSDTVRVVFHATAVHVREHRFLVPIIKAVVAARPTVAVEIIADRSARRLWSGIDRVEIVPPMNWASYLNRTLQKGADIALVPLLPSRANRARAETKRIDVVRLGAAGIFSRSEAYGEGDVPGELIIRNRRHLWIDAVLQLIDDPAWRATVAAASRSRVEGMSEQAAEGIPSLIGRGMYC
jgi:hypothetical protein